MERKWLPLFKFSFVQVSFALFLLTQQFYHLAEQVKIHNFDYRQNISLSVTVSSNLFYGIENLTSYTSSNSCNGQDVDVSVVAIVLLVLMLNADDARAPA
jgi:hypothetical protein